MTQIVPVAGYVAGYEDSPLSAWSDLEPWVLVARSASIVRSLLVTVGDDEFVIRDDVAVHRTARVEAGAVLKGPLVLGARCFVAAGTYFRGGSWIAEDCTFGPGVELKSSFVFAGTSLAHFNFVGDSILGANVNLEAGCIICNHRNERLNKEVQVRLGAELHRTGCEKFGALVGDGSRLGANSVIAPGALLRPASIVRRAALCDQEDAEFAGHVA